MHAKASKQDPLTGGLGECILTFLRLEFLARLEGLERYVTLATNLLNQAVNDASV